MKVGDLIQRKPNKDFVEGLLGPLGYGIIISRQMSGSNPVHPCASVLYPSVGKIYDIAESLIEVINESR
jgi:hypothetical protein